MREEVRGRKKDGVSSETQVPKLNWMASKEEGGWEGSSKCVLTVN